MIGIMQLQEKCGGSWRCFLGTGPGELKNDIYEEKNRLNTGALMAHVS
ncbi:hypothetical protein HMPREF9996_01806 [Aggregatibacter actinomycetemcomitans Y4]|nr:hypothetical protein [Aggregatibacter actinomycetemcomitans]EKX94567.1 hypothetical protein HMPREF9996_01806 [Aggregatibacter actinomycetemcomitans Y4]